MDYIGILSKYCITVDEVCHDPRMLVWYTIQFSFFLRLDLGARINTLPKESRIVLTVFGLKIIEAESKADQPQYIREEIGWAAVQCFSFDGYVIVGLLSLLTHRAVASNLL